MAVRIRLSGEVVCAAMQPAEPGDVYVHDGVAYELCVEHGLLVTDDDHLRYPDGAVGHGRWWWRGEPRPGDLPPVQGTEWCPAVMIRCKERSEYR